MKSRNPEEIEQDIERTRSQMRSTLDAIEEKLAPQRLLETAMDTVREVVSADSGIGRTIRNNPIPLALMGLGAAWLLVAATRKTDTAREEYDDTGYGYRGTAGEVGYSSGGDYTSDYEAAGEGVQGKAGRILGQAKDTASRYATDISDRASGWAEGARSQVGDLTQRATDLYDRHPLAVGIGAVAVGALIGASLGRTKAEDDLLGRHRDDLFRQAEQTAKDALQKGEAMAAKAIEGVRDAAGDVAGEVAGQASGSTGGRVMH